MTSRDTDQRPGVGSALRYLRNLAGLSQDDVGLRLGSEGGRSVSAVWISQVENQRRHPSRDLVTRLLAAYGSDQQALARLLESRPWEEVSEGSEFHAGPESPAALMSQPGGEALVRSEMPQSRTRSSKSRRAFNAGNTDAGRVSRGSTILRSADSLSLDPPRESGLSAAGSGSSASIVAEAAEVAVLYSQLPRAKQIQMLAGLRFSVRGE